MKLLLVGLHTGWMGLHLSHFASAFQQSGITVFPADYHKMGRLFGVFKGSPDAERERRDRALERMVQILHPDIVLFAAGWNFNLERLKCYYRGIVILYDYDGPRRKSLEDFLSIPQVDCFLTVSGWLCRELKAKGKEAHYLPHGVNPDYYAPVPLSVRQHQKYGSAISYIGRTTDRRAELCRVVKDLGLVLYGERWKVNPTCRKLGLTDCVRFSRDAAERELVQIYSGSNCVLNMLQEPLEQYRTILSIQAFSIPSTAGCLLSEWVEELPDAFEDGCEVLSFRSPEELRFRAEKCVREPDFARKIGEAGRRRCLAEHTWLHRVKQIKQFLSVS